MIEPALGRMKADSPIEIDRRRLRDADGGRVGSHRPCRTWQGADTPGRQVAL